MADPARPPGGPVGAFCGLLPLVWAVRRKTDGVVARAYADQDPALLALARRVISDGALDEIDGASVEKALERLWVDLCEVAAPAGNAAPAARCRCASSDL